MSRVPLSIVIQAGGASRRMGQDKALVPFLGRTLLEYVLDQIAGFGSETLIITNRPETYEKFGVQLRSDVLPGLGALGGLYSAIYHAEHDRCLLLACDMPFVNRPLLRHMVSLVADHDAVVPRLEPAEFAEPFRAVYRKSCLGPLRTALEAGERRISSALAGLDIRFVDRVEIDSIDPGARSFFNINTPEDLEEARRLASQFAPPPLPGIPLRRTQE
ncbi:MAG: molybdenum cofactor guanylyltransferase [Anaerolineae bacterium]